MSTMTTTPRPIRSWAATVTTHGEHYDAFEGVLDALPDSVLEGGEGHPVAVLTFTVDGTTNNDAHGALIEALTAAGLPEGVGYVATVTEHTD